MAYKEVVGILQSRAKPILLGVVAGEVAFSVLYGSGESDFWQHYNSAGAILNQAPIQIYTYPAATAIFFLPLAWLPREIARLAWLGLTYLAFALAFRLLPFTRRNVLGWLAWPPTFINTSIGQLDCFVLLAIALAWTLYTRKRDLAAGAILALGLVKAHLLLPLVFLGLLKNRRRWLAGFLPAAALFGAISIFLPQSFPGRTTFFLSWYIQNYRGTGIPARASELPIVWWLAFVITLGGGWVALAVLNQRLGWLALPLVHPYFLMYDLVLVAPALAASKFVLLLYLVVGLSAFWESRLFYVTLGLGLGLLIECVYLLKKRGVLIGQEEDASELSK